MIQTSYYSNKQLRYATGKFRLIGISQGVPKWFDGEVFKALAPTWQMVRMKDMEKYTQLYKSEILAKLNPVKLADLLDDTILLCWEKPGEFCHRRLVAEWLEAATGVPVPEFEGHRSFPRRQAGGLSAASGAGGARLLAVEGRSPQAGPQPEPKQMKLFSD